MRLTKCVSYFLLIILLGVVLLVGGDIALAYSGKLCRGLRIADVQVGGLSVAEAEQKVAAALQEKQSKPVVTMQFEDNKWEVAWNVVSGLPDAASLVRQAYGTGRTGNLMQRLQDQFAASNGGSALPPGLIADTEMLRALVVAAAGSVDMEAVDATIEETPAGVRLTPDRGGRRTDVSSSVRELVKAIESGHFADIPLVVAEKPAAIREQDLRAIDSLVAAFTTTYDVSDENRSRNIQIAAARLAGVLIRSGEVFSFNDRVGLRSPESGYKQAPTLSSTGMHMDWGGGVCQVSSTLYNAALLADFSVVERSPHYQPPAYVPLGQDATVANDQIDLKIKNTRNHAVYFRSVADAGNLEVRIYGRLDKASPTLRIESTEKTVHVPQTIVKQDPTLPLGQEVIESQGSNGFEVTVYRIKLQGGREISREKISTDEFAGSDRVLRVGTLSSDGKATK